jgi:hypothetical protein
MIQFIAFMVFMDFPIDPSISELYCNVFVFCFSIEMSRSLDNLVRVDPC